MKTKVQNKKQNNEIKETESTKQMKKLLQNVKVNKTEQLKGRLFKQAQRLLAKEVYNNKKLQDYITYSIQLKADKMKYTDKDLYISSCTYPSGYVPKGNIVQNLLTINIPAIEELTNGLSEKELKGIKVNDYYNPSIMPNIKEIYETEIMENLNNCFDEQEEVKE